MLERASMDALSSSVIGAVKLDAPAPPSGGF
jgi:hypothetical protein